MAKSLDFNKVKKQFFPVTLPCDDKPILVGTPNKALLTELIELQKSVDSIPEDNVDEFTDAMYDVVARIMSINKSGTVITAKELSEKLDDIEYLFIFCSDYMDFLNDIVSQKN